MTCTSSDFWSLSKEYTLEMACAAVFRTYGELRRAVEIHTTRTGQHQDKSRPHSVTGVKCQWRTANTSATGGIHGNGAVTRLRKRNPPVH